MSHIWHAFWNSPPFFCQFRRFDVSLFNPGVNILADLYIYSEILKTAKENKIWYICKPSFISVILSVLESYPESKYLHLKCNLPWQTWWKIYTYSLKASSIYLVKYKLNFASLSFFTQFLNMWGFGICVESTTDQSVEVQQWCCILHTVYSVHSTEHLCM